MTRFVCAPCVRQQEDCDQCRDCGADMDPGILCIGCAERPATMDDFCVNCIAVNVMHGIENLDDQPAEWREEIAAEVKREVDARDRCLRVNADIARAEFLSMLAMVARAPIACGRMTSVKERV